MSVEPFNRLVKLAARAFYDDITMKGDNQPKNGRGDNRGMAVVVLDSLTRRQWVREEDFAKEIKLHSKQLRKILRFFEEEKLVTRDHRKESAKGSKVFVAASAAAHGEEKGKEGEEKVKMHTHSYCCLDYAQIFDVVRYRMHKMKKKLKDELDSRNTIQMYICPNCGRKYSAFDALNLISFTDEYFHCENCNGELVAESDKLAAEEMGDGDDNARKRRREKLKGILEKIEEQLKPLVVQLNRVKDLPVPDFGTLQAWEASAAIAARAGGKLDPDDPNKSSQFPGYSGTPMPYLGETKVEVALSGIDAKQEDTQSETKPAAQKVLPPWMIKEGMVLTKEQRGESSSHHHTSSTSELEDDKKQDQKTDSKEVEEKRLQDEYVKQYYEALARAQEEAKMKEDLFGGSPESEGERKAGVKREREEDDDDEFEWEDGDANNGDNNEGSSSVKLTADLNVEAKEESEDEAGDDIDWEDG
ncbi:hypothetical protein LUZ60_003943 [Juncus effusus]|nr:hypothetical protein LUZ60_003943 [Juncus effusus]